MATPLTPRQMLAALKAEGVNVVEWPGWRDRCRCHSGSHEKGVGPTGRAWGPVNGVMIHHTGDDGQSDSYVRNVLVSGYTALPGPLCHAAGRMNGEVVLVGSGRANHAGGGDPDVLSDVIRESYKGELDPDVGNKGGTDGNDNFYGLEVMYDGGQPMTTRQLDSAVRYAAAICRAHGWSAMSVIGHREWSSDKPDPGHQDMNAFRRLVQARLDSTPTTGTKPPTGDEIDMADLDDLRKMMREEVDRRMGDVVPAPDAYGNKDKNPTWVVANAIAVIINNQDRQLAADAKRDAMLDALAKKVLTADEISAAAAAGTKAALDARIESADVTINVNQEG